MALLLTIDTSTATASICLSDGERPLASLSNDQQKDHASWLHPAINQALNEAGFKPKELQGIGVTSGPGSYTGLRVGMATAKGLCFTLKIPLVTVNTLEAMADAAKVSIEAAFYCPMIDARRMEVFTALYHSSLQPLFPPQALILSDASFGSYLKQGKVVFFGDGSKKFSEITRERNALFSDLTFSASDTLSIINKKYNLSLFADLVYLEPEYLKEFHHSTQIK